jgi:DNA-binding NarL/FixJ family response regulator
MEFVVEGQLSKQIAAKLGLSEITVKVRRASIMKKMGAASRVACATTVVTPNGTAWWRAASMKGCL